MGGSQDLIETVYASVVEPGRYDELMAAWANHLEGLLQDESDPSDGGARHNPEALERHFLRAFTLLERLGRPLEDTHSLEALIEADARPAMLVNSEGRIVSANAAAGECFGAVPGRLISSLDFEASGVANMRHALAKIAGEPVGRLLTVSRILSAKGGATPIMTLTRAPRPEGAAPVALLAAADIGWTDRLAQIFKQVFGLTEAECEITRSIVDGDSADEIASWRGRSPATVRTQTKSVLRKLEVRSQAELIRLVAALTRSDGGADSLAELNERSPFCSQTTLVRDGNRPLQVAVFGPSNGRPVLFVHGMLDGHGLTKGFRDALVQHKLRLIAPSRPSFGASAPEAETGGSAPERFAKDLEAVLDHFGIERCPVIGHMAGSVYAFAAASSLPERISGVISIAGGVPIISSRQFAIMTPRQRLVAYTARYTPKLLPTILRAGIALLDSGGDYAFMNALYENAPDDFRTARRPEVFRILCDGYRFSVAQGHRAFEIDSQHVTRDWSDYSRASHQPVTLLHGQSDPVVGIDSVRTFASALGPRALLTEIPATGQLLFYSHPEVVVDAMQRHAMQA